MVREIKFVLGFRVDEDEGDYRYYIEVSPPDPYWRIARELAYDLCFKFDALLD